MRFVRSGGVRLAALALLIVSGSLAPQAALADDQRWEPVSKPMFVLPAEFDRQEAVLVSWDADDQGMQFGVIDIIASAWTDIPFVMLVPSAEAEFDALRALRDAGVPRRAVRFLQVPTDSVWTRDFGPQVVRHRDGTCRLIDSDYGHGDRVGDDLVPAAIAPTLGLRTLRPPITADGGNIQSNGRGVALTTTAILDHNVDRGYTPDDVARLFRDYYGVESLVFLEPLEGESTGHVDMFAVFVSADTVVVGSYDHHEDPVNSELLDRNAARLRRVMGPNGPLRVIRTPMPPHSQKIWRTYTNVLFANGTLVVPMYRGVDPQGHSQAVDIYRRLLPGWKVVGVDCNQLIKWGGAIHCMTMNLAEVPALQQDGGRLPFIGTRNAAPESPQFPAHPMLQQEEEPRSPDFSPELAQGRRRNTGSSYGRPFRPRRRPSFEEPRREFERPEPSAAPAMIEPEWYPYRPQSLPSRDERRHGGWNRRSDADEEGGEDEFRRGELNDGRLQTAERTTDEFPMPSQSPSRRSMFVPDRPSFESGHPLRDPMPFDAGDSPNR